MGHSLNLTQRRSKLLPPAVAFPSSLPTGPQRVTCLDVLADALPSFLILTSLPPQE